MEWDRKSWPLSLSVSAHFPGQAAHGVIDGVPVPRVKTADSANKGGCKASARKPHLSTSRTLAPDSAAARAAATLPDPLLSR